MPIIREIKTGFGPLDFNELIERKIPFFDEEGHLKDMHLILAVNKGLEIAEALDQRVKKFFQDFENQSSAESSIERDNLLNQFKRLPEFVESIDETLGAFSEMIKGYDPSNEQAIDELYPIMDKKDVHFTKANLGKIKREMLKLYINKSPLPSVSTLADRIQELQQRVIEV